MSNGFPGIESSERGHRTGGVSGARGDSPTRRQLLWTSAAGLTATMSPSALAAVTGSSTPGKPAGKDATARSHTYKISLAGYSLRDRLDEPGKRGQMSLMDMVDYATELRLDAIEPTSYYFFRDDDAFVFELKRKAFLAGIEISSMPIRGNFCLPSGPELDKEMDYIRHWVDIAAKLGVPAMRIFAGRPDQSRPREEAYKNAVQGMKKACDIAGARGIFLAIENHGYLTETADDLFRLLDAVQHDWLGINLDTGNFIGNPYADIARAAPKAVTCQVKIQILKPDSKEREPADFARIVDILRRANYRGYLTLEYEGKDPTKEIPEYIAKLQALARPA